MHRGGLLDLQLGRSREYRSGLNGRRRRRQLSELAASGFVEVRVHLADDSFDWTVDVIEEGLGINADPEGQGNQREKDGVLPEVQIRECLVNVMRHGAEHGALIEPKQIGGAENDAEGAPGSPGFANDERTLKNGEFSDEAIEKRHAERTEANDQIDCREVGHRSGQATEFGNEACVAALVEHAYD